MLTIYSSPSEWRQNSPMPVRNGEDAIALGSAFQLALFLFLDPLPAFEIYHFYPFTQHSCMSRPTYCVIYFPIRNCPL